MTDSADSARDPYAELAARAAPALRERRLIAAVGPALATAVGLLPVVPLVIVVVQLLRLAGGYPPHPQSAVALTLLTVIPALAWFLLRLVYVDLREIDEVEALAIADRAAGAGERLLTAREFARRETVSPFERAAIEDAQPFLERAQSIPIDVDRGHIHLPLRAAKPIFATAALMPIAVALSGFQPRHDDAGMKSVAVDVDPRDASSNPGDEDDPTRSDKRDTELRTPRPRELDKRDTESTAQVFATGLTEQIKESAGKTGAGQSSNAESISGQSDSQSTPTNQAQSSKDAAQNKLGSKKPERKRDTPPAERTPRKELNEASGATAGRGSSSGSNKNPATTDWSSKDQVTTPDDQELAQDEEVEDESEDSHARGGIQPSLRDRRPPVSRDLQIGFGNGKNPDANGRGGPSARKKSRGTAALVLGVPIPDRIKGQPNPGKTKITQERVKPREEESQPRDAQPRDPRVAPVGHLADPDLPPWMQRLVRDYFLTLRSQERGDP